FNSVLSNIIIGKKRLEGYKVGFHRKIILYSFFLGFYTFFAGIFVIASQGISGDELYFLIFTILFTLGIGVGVVEIFLIVRFIDLVSRGNYDTGRAAPQSD
ncbi:MAG: hypothetical protein ACFFDT_21645, partial [Candidatus Hodarchaeota archaeon]